MEEKIKNLIKEPLNEKNFVVDSINFEKGNLNIILDSASIIDLDRIVEVSKIVNEILDKEDIIKEKYVLDISSKEKGGN